MEFRVGIELELRLELSIEEGGAWGYFQLRGEGVQVFEQIQGNNVKEFGIVLDRG